MVLSQGLVGAVTDNFALTNASIPPGTEYSMVPTLSSMLDVDMVLFRGLVGAVRSFTAVGSVKGSKFYLLIDPQMYNISIRMLSYCGHPNVHPLSAGSRPYPCLHP